MQIKSAIVLKVSELVAHKEPDYVTVTYCNDGNIEGLAWPFNSSDSGLYGMVKRRGGVWDRDARMWTFSDEKQVGGMLAAIKKRNPGWPILDNLDENHTQFLTGVQFSRINLDGGKAACLLTLPLSYFAKVNAPPEVCCFKLISQRHDDSVALLVADENQLLDLIVTLEEQGAVADATLANRWKLNAESRVQIKASGWAVKITCDLSNPLHYLIAPEQKYRWEGTYPYGVKVAVPWNGDINTTRKLWSTWKAKVDAAGIGYGGDEPSADIALPSAFNVALVPGWSSPAPNGCMLHEYQKEGISFCSRRGMRAMIGDEMGIGKTAQAIAAAESMAAQRVLVICPANARYVWDREIKGWGGGGKVQHINSQLDTLDMSARWNIATYDLLVSKSETWRLRDVQEEKAFLAAFPERVGDVMKGGYPKPVSLSKFSTLTPAFGDTKRIASWSRTMRRLHGELVAQILAAGPLMVIMDEAHRAKNRDAKRTKAIQRIAESEAQILLLTGTPLRNNEHEAAVLLSFLDADAANALGKDKGYTIQDVKDYLGYFMIRRTKSEVLPELPEKTRQRIDIELLDNDALAEYRGAIDNARQLYIDARDGGSSEAQARQSAQGAIEKSRTALGLAKTRGGAVADLVAEVVEHKECCVVFCAHHRVSDELMAQLHKEGIKSAVVDGRTPQIERARIERDFQNGDLQVFIGGINAAGEAITLTRADTVVFVEMDWVPAALLQAEDRIHRVGQRSNCQIIHLVAQLPGFNLDEEMIVVLGSKLERIGTVLSEGTDNIVHSEGIRAEIHNRLLGKL